MISDNRELSEMMDDACVSQVGFHATTFPILRGVSKGSIIHTPERPKEWSICSATARCHPNPRVPVARAA